MTNDYIKNTILKMFVNCDEDIDLVDEETREKTTISLLDFLDIKLYTYKYRIPTIEDWVSSINGSLKSCYGIVEKINEEPMTSNTIKGSTIQAKVTFLVPTNNVDLLEYLVSKVKNTYLGVKYENMFFNFSSFVYEEEPTETGIGESVVVSTTISISYIENALTYSDDKFEISFDEEEYYELPLIGVTFQKVFTGNTVPTFSKPTITGYVNNSASSVVTMSFYDFNTEICRKLKEEFFSTSTEVNIPLVLRVNEKYTFTKVIKDMQYVYQNNDFTIASMTLYDYGKGKVNKDVKEN